MNDSKLAKLNDDLRSLSLPKRMAYIFEQFPSLTFTTSFSTEDQLLTWAIVDAELSVSVATHLEGLLLEQTRSVHEITKERYDMDIPTGAENGGEIWISGRAQHALNADRKNAIAIWHADKAMLEINPLADWSFEEVLQAIAEHEVPINPLFGYSGSRAQMQSGAISSTNSKPRPSAS